MLINGACYIRVSTDEQTEYSPDAQLRMLKDYAGKHHILLHDEHIYIDAGLSGRKAEKRPAFMRMIAAAKTRPKPFEVILVHKFDRFARSREDSVVYKSLLKKEAGVRVTSITESIEDDKFSVILEAMLEAMAEYYSINLAEEVKKGMTEKAYQGGFQTAPALGYRLDQPSGTLRIVEDEAAYVRYIFDRFVEHDEGKAQIARQLCEQGAASKRGNPIDRRHIDYILQNPVYIGKLRWTPTGKARRNFHHPDTIIAEGAHEPIIPDELFQKAADKIAAQRRPAARPSPGEGSRHWLSGLIKCSNCGASLTSTGMRGPCPSFQCRGYRRALCPVSHSLSIEKAEHAVKDELSRAICGILADDEAITYERAAGDTAAQAEAAALGRQLDALARHLQRAREAYWAGTDDLAEYEKNKRDIKQRRQALEARLDGIAAQRADTAGSDTPAGCRMQNVLDVLNAKGDMRAKQRAVRRIIERIIYDRPHSCIEIYYRDV